MALGSNCCSKHRVGALGEAGRTAVRTCGEVKCVDEVQAVVRERGVGGRRAGRGARLLLNPCARVLKPNLRRALVQTCRSGTRTRCQTRQCASAGAREGKNGRSRTVTAFVGVGAAASATGSSSSLACVLRDITMMRMGRKMMFVRTFSIAYLLLASSSVLEPDLDHPFT